MGAGWSGANVWEEVLVMIGFGGLGARVWWPIKRQQKQESNSYWWVKSELIRTSSQNANFIWTITSGLHHISCKFQSLKMA